VFVFVSPTSHSTRSASASAACKMAAWPATENSKNRKTFSALMLGVAIAPLPQLRPACLKLQQKQISLHMNTYCYQEQMTVQSLSDTGYCFMQGDGVTADTCRQTSGCCCVAAPTPVGMLEVATEAGSTICLYILLAETNDRSITVRHRLLLYAGRRSYSWHLWSNLRVPLRCCPNSGRHA
jgi:hypothetical protein